MRFVHKDCAAKGCVKAQEALDCGRMQDTFPDSSLPSGGVEECARLCAKTLLDGTGDGITEDMWATRILPHLRALVARAEAQYDELRTVCNRLMAERDAALAAQKRAEERVGVLEALLLRSRSYIDLGEEAASRMVAALSKWAKGAETGYRIVYCTGTASSVMECAAIEKLADIERECGYPYRIERVLVFPLPEEPR